MVEYIPTLVHLSDNQKQKIKSCFNKNESCRIIIQPGVGNIKLHLTKSQIDKLKQAKDKAVTIELSKTQLSKTGGFILPLLSAVAPLIARAALTGAVSYGAQKALQKVTKGKGAILPQRKYGNGLKKKK